MFYRINWKVATRELLVTSSPSAVPPVHAGYISAGSFQHTTPVPDNLGPAGVNHVLFHHIRDALYFQGVQDMHRIRILPPIDDTPPVVLPLGPDTLTYVVNASTGSVIANITGLSTGETVTGFTPNDGRLSLNGAQLLKGASASSAGTFNVVITTSTGRTKTIAATVTPIPVTLGALTLSGSLVNGAASSGTINGATVGSTITSTLAGLTVNSAARTYSFDGSAVAGTTNSLVETLAAGTNSPKTNAITVNAAPATLAALSVTPNVANIGIAYSGNIVGKTFGSTVTLSGAGSAGLTVTGSAITGTPTTAGAINVIETLAGISNSPRTTNSVVTTSAPATNFPDISDYSTNAISNPSDVSQTSWNKTAVTVATGQLSRNNGTLAQLVSETTATSNHGLLLNALAKPAGTRLHRLFRANIKASGAQWIRPQFATADYATGVNAFFDIVNGVASFTQTPNYATIPGYAIKSAAIAPLSFGWFRIEVDYYTDTDSAGRIVQALIALTNNDFATHDGLTTRGFLCDFWADVDADSVLATQTAVPVNTAAPIVWGLDVVAGTNLSVWPGSYTNQPTSFTYQWYANGTAISGATRFTCSIGNTDVLPITAIVTPINNFGTGVGTSSDGSINDGIDHTQEWLTAHNFPTAPEPTNTGAVPAFGSLMSGTSNVAYYDFTPTGNVTNRATLDSLFFMTTMNGASETGYPVNAVTGPIDDPTSGSSYARIRRFAAGHRYDLHTFGPNGLKLGVIGKNNGKIATNGNIYAGFIRPQTRVIMPMYMELTVKNPSNPHSWMPFWLFTGDQVSPGRVAGSSGNPNYKPDGTHSLINRASIVVTTATPPVSSSQYQEYDILDAWKLASVTVGKSLTSGNVQRTNRTSGLTKFIGYIDFMASDSGFAISADNTRYSTLTADSMDDGFHVLGFNWRIVGPATMTTENGNIPTKRYPCKLDYIKDGKIFRSEYFEYVNNQIIDPITGATVDPAMHILIGGQSHPSFVAGVAASDISNWDTYAMTIKSLKIWNGNIDLTTLTTPTNGIVPFSTLRLGDGAIAYAGVPFKTYTGGKRTTDTTQDNTKIVATSDDGTILTNVGATISGTFAAAGSKNITLIEYPDANIASNGQGMGIPKTTNLSLVVQATDPGYQIGGATNLRTYSGEFANAVWTKTGLTGPSGGAIAQDAVGPDGVTVNASTIWGTATSVAHVMSSTLAVTNGSTNTVFALVKKGNMRVFQIAAGSTGTGGITVNFDLDNAGNPTILTPPAGLVVKVLNSYNGFYVFVITFVATGTGTATFTFGHYAITTALRGQAVLGTTADNTIIGGVQMVAGSTPGNYTARSA